MAKIFHKGNEEGSYFDTFNKEVLVKFMGEGQFEIFQSDEDLIQQLFNIEKAGRTCYRSEPSITTEGASKFIRGIIKRGHESVIEHSLITVKFTNVSRGFTHEMVRHRLCAFSQESTRYVDYAKDSNEIDLDKFEKRFIFPPHREKSEQCLQDFSVDHSDVVTGIEENYRNLRKQGWTPEDARQFLPNGLCADIVVSANFREWRHIFEMRTQKSAHWEIRDCLNKLLVCLKNTIPVIFEDFIFVGYDKNGYAYFKKGN